jgi:hypothetical protein
MTPNYEIIKMISEGPETQIDPQMSEILKELAGKPTPEVRVGLHKALDYGARYALASGFVMTALDGEWKRLGGKPSDPTPWRKEMK